MALAVPAVVGNKLGRSNLRRYTASGSARARFTADQRWVAATLLGRCRSRVGAVSVESRLTDVGPWYRIAPAIETFDVLARRAEVVGQRQDVIRIEDAKQTSDIAAPDE
jgi:hypothetical protein